MTKSRKLYHSVFIYTSNLVEGHGRYAMIASFWCWWFGLI